MTVAGQRPPWEAYPYRLVSLGGLLLMIANDGYACYQLAQTIHVLHKKGQLKLHVSEEGTKAYLNAFRAGLRVCERLGLRVSATHIRSVIDVWLQDGFEAVFQQDLFSNCRSSLQIELENVQFKHLTGAQAALYEVKQPFGEIVANGFEDANYDIEEAAKCLALGRGTACVFHLMRAMEVPLIALGHAVGVKQKSPTWEAVLGAIDRRLDPTAKKGRWKRRDEPFFADANRHLRAVKISVRNPAIHRGTTFTEEKAREIYDHVRVFFEHVATRITQRPKRV